MLIRFVCLANSLKEGGRCIAGIELDYNNIPKIDNEYPKWVRPVCNTIHGEIPTRIAEPFKILDIIEVDVIKPQPENHQSENIFFNISSIHRIGIFDKNKLDNLFENRKYIFATPYSFLSEETIKELTYSLMLIKTEKFEVIDKIFAERPDKSQQRLVFIYNEIQYDFSITDPVFLKNYRLNPDFLKNINELTLCLSVGIKFPVTNKYYKLVPGIIF